MVVISVVQNSSLKHVLPQSTMTRCADVLYLALCTVSTLWKLPFTPSILGELCLNLAHSFAQRDLFERLF